MAGFDCGVGHVGIVGESLAEITEHGYSRYLCGITAEQLGALLSAIPIIIEQVRNFVELRPSSKTQAS